MDEKIFSLRLYRDCGSFDKEPEKNGGNFLTELRTKIELSDENLMNHFEACRENAISARISKIKRLNFVIKLLFRQ